MKNEIDILKRIVLVFPSLAALCDEHLETVSTVIARLEVIAGVKESGALKRSELQAKHAALFVLRILIRHTSVNYGTFYLIEALAVWDRPHRSAFSDVIVEHGGDLPLFGGALC